MEFNYKAAIQYMTEHRCTDPLCGYIRGPQLEQDTITGFCALNDRRCCSKLPMQELECKVMQEFFLKRRLFNI